MTVFNILLSAFMPIYCLKTDSFIKEDMKAEEC